jgi:hypothetical protein
MDKKTAMLNCHVSQVYEWLPWTEDCLSEVPPENDPEGRVAWLKNRLGKMDPLMAGRCREALAERYGREKGGSIQNCEAFQLCEYGRQNGIKEIMNLFPL